MELHQPGLHKKGKVEMQKMWRFCPSGYPFYGYDLGGADLFVEGWLSLKNNLLAVRFLGLMYP